jgi:sulfatase maturation enzyme AslB (radical SAM superfamily)
MNQDERTVIDQGSGYDLSRFTDPDVTKLLLSCAESDGWRVDCRRTDVLSLSQVVDSLFCLLSDENAQVSRHSAQVLASLLDDVILERFAPPAPRMDLWQDAPRWLCPALFALERFSQNIVSAFVDRQRDPASFARLCLALGSQPGLVTALEVPAESGDAQELAEFLQLFEPYGSSRQIALAPTYFCSGKCSYCYSQGLASDFPHAMSFESFQRVVEWMKQNGIDLLLLAGGEPTEYPYINAALELLRREKLRTYIATNNLFNPGQLNAIGQDVVDRVSVHLWHQDRYSPALWDRFRRNLDLWRSKDIRVSLRYNLLAPQYDPSDLFELCIEFDILHLSLGLVFPVPNGAYVSDKDFGLFAPLLFDLTQECQHRGLHIQLAKPLPWCAFSEEQVRLLKRAKMFSAVCSIHHHRGTQNVMVNPDLSTFACQALPTSGKSLLSFQGIEDLADEYEEKVNSALAQPLYDECVDCYYYRLRACQGACLAYKRMPSMLPPNSERHLLARKADELVTTQSR